jgi:ectoine hydroxylase-related dioxygenase (phytanoyl-CoA dioxygenase family)
VKANTDLRSSGFLVAKNLFNPDRIRALRPICEQIRRQWVTADPLTSAPSDSPSTETCLRHVIHPSYFTHGDTSQLNELLELFAHSGIRDILRGLWSEEPVFRSTSLFFSPEALDEEGNWHRDSQFVYPHISREKEEILCSASAGGRGMQIQIPLYPDSSLEYVQGSHIRWDTNEEFWIRRADKETNNKKSIPSASRLSVSPGDAVFFDPNGIHRGRYRSSPYRLTLMVTYTRSSGAPLVDRFSYQPWFLEKSYLSGIPASIRQVYEKFLLHYNSWEELTVDTKHFHSGRRSPKPPAVLL